MPVDIRELAPAKEGLVPRHPWELSRRWFTQQLVESIRRRSPRPINRIVDVGCGDAFITKRLAACYPETRFDGIDTALSSELLGKLSHDAGCPNLRLTSSLEQLQADRQPVGLVLLLDVLEHVADDAVFLKALAKSPFLDKEAYFLLTVPAFPLLYSSHDLLLGHFRRYYFREIRQIARKAGLTVLEGGHCYLSGFWFRAQQSLREKLRHSDPLLKTEVSCWRGGKLKTWLTDYLLRLDLLTCRLLAKLGVRLPGLSCYLLCQRHG